MDHGRKLYVGNTVLDHSRDSVKYTYLSGSGRNEGFDACIRLLWMCVIPSITMLDYILNICNIRIQGPSTESKA